jgi:acetoin:2,6-dichlorophenolindophenol oxidoreductase subunit alpha
MPLDNPALYRQMLRIRRFEETVLERFSEGLFYGTTHTSIGQEADAVGVLSCLEAGDVVVSNHRCHGHFLAYGGPMEGLAAELMGRASGVCGGRGGSQHIVWRNFYSNGVLGGTLPVASGMALAEKRGRTGYVVVAFLGDGALGEGAVYESLNMASLWSLPILFVLENNRYAQTTPIQHHLAGDPAARFGAFGIPFDVIETTDVLEIRKLALAALREIRAGRGPRALVIGTYRLAPHSKGDDIRDPAEIEAHRRLEPLRLQAGRLSAVVRASIEGQVEEEVELAMQRAAASPAPDPARLTPALDGIT